MAANCGEAKIRAKYARAIQFLDGNLRLVVDDG
jgi:hypothetical protein